MVKVATLSHGLFGAPREDQNNLESPHPMDTMSGSDSGVSKSMPQGNAAPPPAPPTSRPRVARRPNLDFDDFNEVGIDRQIPDDASGQAPGTTLQHDIESLPQPPPERIPSSHELSAPSPNLFNPSYQREDSNQTLIHLTEESSPPLAPALKPYDVQRLLYHTSALLRHSKASRELDDVNSTIRNLRCLLDYPIEDFSVLRHSVTRSLAEMVATRVDMKEEAGDALKDINEIVDLCGKLLTQSPDTSPPYLARASQALTQAVLGEYRRGRQLLPPLLGQTIGFLREALKTCRPDFRHVSLNLANLLAVRFLTSPIEDDYEEARQVLDETTQSPSPGDRNDPYIFQASSLSTALGFAQSIRFSSPEDLGAAISRCYSFIDHSSLFGNPLHPVITELLQHHASTFSKNLGPGQGVPTAHLNVGSLLSPLPLDPMEGGVSASGHDTIQTGPSPLVEVEGKIRGLRNHVSTTKLGTDGRKEGLRELVRLYDFKIHRTKNIGDITEAIKYHRMLLDSIHPCDSSRFMDLSNLANLLLQAYEQTHETGTEYLYASIDLHYEVLEQESAKVTHFRTNTRLISLLSIRHRLSNCERDMDEVMDRYKSGVNDIYTTAPSRFELACRWAAFARIHRHSSLLVAYQISMSLLQEALTFEPTDCLVEKHYLYETMPLNFASYQIREGQVEHAIETLEQGRALLWSEMHGLRTSSHRLRAEFPILADCFTAINRELEVLTTSSSPSGNVDIDNWEALARGGDGQHQRLMVQRQGLLKKRIELISQIQDLENFKDFLKPPSFDTLRSAASRGVVIIINHCKWRSDIIMVLGDSPPSHI